MKTWIMTLGLVTLAATAMTAQDSRLIAKEEAHQGGVFRQTIHAGEFYGRVISYMQANNEQVRFQCDDMVWRMTRDQDFLKALESLNSYRFESLLEALNVLASHGWEVRTSMVLNGRNGEEQHILMARPVDNMMPASPWLDKRPTEGGRQK